MTTEMNDGHEEAARSPSSLSPPTCTADGRALQPTLTATKTTTTPTTTNKRKSSTVNFADRDGAKEKTAEFPASRAQRMQSAGRRGSLSIRSMNFNIPTNQGAHDHAKEEHGTHSWRYKALQFLHSSKVQKILMALLFADVIILFVELLFLANYPHCTIIERDAISCCPISTEERAQHDRRWLADGGEGDGDGHGHDSNHYHDYCDQPGLTSFAEYPAGCDEHKWHVIHTVEEVLFALTITILSIFMVELNIAMIALKPQIFFRQFFFMLDYVIITVSLVLELTFHFLNDAIYQSAAGLLVIVRIWRFVRIGHAIVEITNERAHEEYSGLLAYTEALETILREHSIPLPECTWSKLKHGGSGHGSGGASAHSSSGNNNILSELELADREKWRQKFVLNSNHPVDDPLTPES